MIRWASWWLRAIICLFFLLMSKAYLFKKHVEKIFHPQAAATQHFFLIYSEHIESLNSWQPDCWCALAPSAAAIHVIVFHTVCTYIIINTLKNHPCKTHIFYSIWIKCIIRIFWLIRAVSHNSSLYIKNHDNNNTIKNIHHIYPNNKTEFRSLLAFSLWGL